MRLKSFSLRHITLVTVSIFGLTGYLAFKDCHLANAQPSPQPQYDGKIIRQESTGRVFWIDQGVRRWIDRNSPEIWGRLFNSVRPEVQLDLEKIMPLGPLITGKNELVRCSENGNPLSGRVYFMDQNQKRWVSSPNMMKKYNFNGNGIKSVPCSVIGAVADGPTFK